MSGPWWNSLSPEAQAEVLALIDARVAEALADLRSPDDPVWLSVPQAAERLGVSEGALRAAVKRGSLPSYRFERRVLLKVEDVDSFPRRSS